MTKSPNDKPEWQYDRNLYDPDDFAGFSYIIEHLASGKKYIGRKYLNRTSKRKIIGASDWLTYWGSSKTLTEDIKRYGHAAFQRTVLEFCKSRSETNYSEVVWQFKLDVLRSRLPDGSRAFYNQSISTGRFFAPPDGPLKPTKVQLKYDANPKICSQCQQPVKFERRHLVTCSAACVAQAKALNCGILAITRDSQGNAKRARVTRRENHASTLGFDTRVELEAEVHRLRAGGLTREKIADKLGCSFSFIKQMFVKRAV